MILTIWTVALAALGVSCWMDAARTRLAIARSGKSLFNLAPGVLSMIAIVGVTLAAFPEQSLVELFNATGIRGYLTVAGVGAVLNIPGPIAFPLAGTLLKMGVKPALLASFITTLTMVGIVTAPMESKSLGRQFTMFRQLLSFAAALLIGLSMGWLL